jgi:hypothetical protein
MILIAERRWKLLGELDGVLPERENGKLRRCGNIMPSERSSGLEMRRSG